MEPLDWTSDNEFVLAGTSYLCLGLMTPGVRSTDERFCIIKGPWLVERYEQLVRQLVPKNIFELGIWDGGSTAFLAQLAEPKKLVAVDLSPAPCRALESFVEFHDLGDRVAIHYGVDQANARQLIDIFEQEYGDELLDLVVDDASHLLDQTRASFNVLFPRLAPGGIYLIEDWSWKHSNVDFEWEPKFRDATPLSVFLFELMLACAQHPTVVEEIVVRKGLALVRRGPEIIDPRSFDVSAAYGEIGRELMRKLGGS